MTGPGPVLLSGSSGPKAEIAAAALRSAGLAAERIRVLLAGGPGTADAGELRRLAAGAAGLLLLGGPDVDPRTFGEEPLPEARLEVEPERDALEWALLEGAREAAVPTWGICRGLQVLDVFLGGTLWQDIPTQLPGAQLHDLSYPRDALIHPIEVTAPDTPLGELLGRETALVNSRHHQGVRRVAPGLTVVGRAPDGLVEAFALAGSDWWLEAVQWHPENLMALAQQRALTERFLAAVAAGPGGAAGTRRG